MPKSETIRAILVTSILVPALMGADVGLPRWAPQDAEGAPILEDASDKVVLEMPEKRLRVDLFAGGTYLFDTNPNLVPNGEGTAISIIDFGFDINMGDPSQQGSYYQLQYTGTRFGYGDDSFSPGGGSLDHLLHTQIGLKKSRTRFRLSSTYRRSNGNLSEYDELSRETRRAASDDLNSMFSIHRDLPHGSLEASFEYFSRNFDGNGLSDGRGYAADMAWYYEPGFAPKTELGFGLRLGSDDFDGLARQQTMTPSFRMRYRMSSKTAVDASFGYERRDLGGVGDQSINSLVYSTGVTWDASARTRWELRANRFVRPSYVTGDGSFEASDVILRLNQRLGTKLRLTASAGFEQADYFGGMSGLATGSRADEFFKAGVNLGYPIKLGEKLDGSIDVFYQYNRNNSSDRAREFEQSVTGVRVGFQY